MASMVDFLAHGLIDNSYFLVDLAFVFFLTLGLMRRLAFSAHQKAVEGKRTAGSQIPP